MCIVFSLSASAQRCIVNGNITDSISGEALPYATVKLNGSNMGTKTDIDGNFTIAIPRSGATLHISYVGYNTREVRIKPSSAEMDYDVSLVPTGVVLSEVTIKPKREKYRKKGNPAVDFVRHVIAMRQSGDPRQHNYFTYRQYEKMVFAKNEYSTKTKKNGKKSRFDFVSEFVDTLDNGVTILPVSEKEKSQTVYYRRSPKTEKSVVDAYRSSGIDEIFSSDGVKKFLDEVFKEVDIFQNNIPLFLQRFVSPLSTIAPNYYKFYLTDTVEVKGERCAELSFVPFNSETFGFTGHLYVTLDSTYFVKKAVLNVPKDINLNFVSHLSIDQEFDRTTDGTRLMLRDDIRVNFKLTERTKGMYAQRLCIYSDHSFEEPSLDVAKVFKQSAPSINLNGANKQTDDYWNTVRPPEAVKRNKNSMEAFMAKLNSVPLWKYSMQFLSTMFNGYIPTHDDKEKSKFEFGPMNSTINYNPLEGTRLRVGGTTTTAFSRRFFMDGYVAYGEKDKKMKYDALLEYSFNDRKEFRKEFPLNSIRLEYMYDINKLGQEYMYTSKDNMVLMIRRKKDSFITYLRQLELTYYRENYSGWAYGAVVRNKREESSPLTQYERIATDGTLQPIGHYDMTEMELKLRYAKNEKFYQTRNIRVPITFDAMIFNVNHRMAAKGFLGSDYNYQRTDIGFQKRFWFSAFGYIDIITKVGKVWTKVPWPLLILPNANLTYTIQPESYTNMNALEFINDEYVSWDITYYMNGNLLNRLPLIKKLKWREVFCFRGLWGNLTDKNDPAKGGEGLYAFPSCTYRMNNTPYMEASVGIENIFKFLRIDYVWRLSYLNHDNIQKHGVRMTMVLSF